jgi:hypothetical protein
MTSVVDRRGIRIVRSEGCRVVSHSVMNSSSESLLFDDWRTGLGRRGGASESLLDESTFRLFGGGRRLGTGSESLLEDSRSRLSGGGGRVGTGSEPLVIESILCGGGLPIWRVSSVGAFRGGGSGFPRAVREAMPIPTRSADGIRSRCHGSLGGRNRVTGMAAACGRGCSRFPRLRGAIGGGDGSGRIAAGGPGAFLMEFLGAPSYPVLKIPRVG